MRYRAAQVALVLFLSGCSGGGGSGDPTLSTAGGNSVGTSPQLTTETALLPEYIEFAQSAVDQIAWDDSSPASTKVASTFDPESDYQKAKTSLRSSGNVFAELSALNSFLCIFSQLHVEEHIDKGPYGVLYSSANCVSNLNASTTSAYPNLAHYVADATTLSSGEIRVRLWLTVQHATYLASNPPITLREIIIRENKKQRPPYGDFYTISESWSAASGGPYQLKNYSFFDATHNSKNEPIFRAIKASGASLPHSGPVTDAAITSTVLTYDDDSFSHGRSLSYYIRTDSLGAITSSVPTTNELGGIAYETFTPTTSTSTEQYQCSKFESPVTATTSSSLIGNARHTLYFAKNSVIGGVAVTAGQRVDQRTSIRYGSSFAANGWLSYWGLISNNSSLINFNPTRNYAISKDEQTFGPGKILLSDGLLSRVQYEPHSILEFRGHEFVWNGPHPGYSSYTGNWIVKISDFGRLLITAAATYSGSSSAPTQAPTFDHDGDPATAEVLAASELIPPNGEVIFLADRNGASTNYEHNSSLASTNRLLWINRPDRINATDATLLNLGASGMQLYCYSNCLKGGVVSSDFTAPDNTLTYDLTALGVDYLSYTAVIDANVVKLIDNRNGLRTTLGDVYNTNALASTRTPTSNTTFLYPVLRPASAALIPPSVDVSYSWTTSSARANHSVYVTDSQDSPVIFNRSLFLLYKPEAAANAFSGDLKDASGNVYRINYYGPERLVFFQATSTFSPPVLNVPNATLLGDGQYITKAAARYFKLINQSTASACFKLDAINLESALTKFAPTEKDVVFPSFGIVDMPQLTSDLQ